MESLPSPWHHNSRETIDEAVYRPADSQHPDAKNPIRIKKVTFYYIDYQIFTNSVKYKIKKMRELLDQQAKQVLTGLLLGCRRADPLELTCVVASSLHRCKNQIDANVGFICSNCKRLYTQIEVSTLPLDPMLGIVCGVFGCGGSLAEQDNSAQRSEQEDVQSR
jgi:transcription initiation factor IIE alpha subunit